MWRFSTVRTVIVLGFALAVVLDDFSGGAHASAARTWARGVGQDLVQMIQARIGRERTEELAAAAKAAAGDARKVTDRQIATLASIVSGERRAARKAEIVDEQ